MTQQRITIRDIAEELGLSTATVSNVIHGKTNKVSDETVRRVQALLEKRQYIPSMAGILLAQNSSKIIGVFINDHEKYEGHTLEDVFISSSLNHLSTEIEAHGQFMMVKKTKNVNEIIQFASMWNMDGLVIIGFCIQDYRYLRDHIRIPFVIYDGICADTDRIFNITIDNFDGGRQVGEYFRKNGHQKALCIADNDVAIDKDRFFGFCSGFQKDDTELLIIPMKKEERWNFYENNLKKFSQVTAVFAASDYYAIDLIHFLQDHDFHIPKDISIAGFDDIPLCEMISPALTTVKQDGALRAQLALKKLREMRDSKETAGELMLPVTFVARDSTCSAF